MNRRTTAVLAIAASSLLQEGCLLLGVRHLADWDRDQTGAQVGVQIPVPISGIDRVSSVEPEIGAFLSFGSEEDSPQLKEICLGVLFVPFQESQQHSAWGHSLGCGASYLSLWQEIGNSQSAEDLFGIYAYYRLQHKWGDALIGIEIRFVWGAERLDGMSGDSADHLQVMLWVLDV